MFGGFGAAAGFRKQMNEAAKLPHRTVSRAEFIRLATAAGMDRPEFHAAINAGLGPDASCRVGNEMLSVKASKNRKA
jgi:hypothetical protein